MTDQTETEQEREESEGRSALFGGLGPHEAARRAVATRRERAAEAESTTPESSAVTARQRLGQVIAETTTAQWRQIWKDASTHAKVRLLDQAYGKPQDAEDDDTPEGSIYEGLTREQRAAMRAILEGEPIPDTPTE